MTKKPKLSDIDKIAFKEAMKGVNRLTHTKKISKSQTPILPIKRRRSRLIDDDHPDFFQFSDYETHPSVGSDEFIKFSRSGIQHKIFLAMQMGQHKIEAKLDLHGMIVTEAREALSRFIHECSHKGIRQILIIHGKGRAHQDPILKNRLNHWLRQTDTILAFCSARPKEGGTGALYVLLKKRHAREA